MKISKIQIRRIAPNAGLVGFASCVLDDSLYIGNIAIFTRLNNTDKIRLVFPIKEVEQKKIPVFHPLTPDLYYQLEKAIMNEYND